MVVHKKGIHGAVNFYREENRQGYLGYYINFGDYWEVRVLLGTNTWECRTAFKMDKETPEEEVLRAATNFFMFL